METNSIALSADSTDDIVAQLKAKYSAEQMQQLASDGVRIAVNQTLIESNTPLSDGDEVAFLPPITGG